MESNLLQESAWGFYVKTVGTKEIHVCRMLFNWRVLRSVGPDHLISDRFWCYKGTGAQSFLAAMAGAELWDGGDDTEPLGWNKNGQTHEWRG